MKLREIVMVLCRMRWKCRSSYPTASVYWDVIVIWSRFILWQSYTQKTKCNRNSLTGVGACGIQVSNIMHAVHTSRRADAHAKKKSFFSFSLHISLSQWHIHNSLSLSLLLYPTNTHGHKLSLHSTTKCPPTQSCLLLSNITCKSFHFAIGWCSEISCF